MVLSSLMHLLSLCTASVYLCRRHFYPQFKILQKMDYSSNNNMIEEVGVDFPIYGDQAIQEKKAESRSKDMNLAFMSKVQVKVSDIGLEQPKSRSVLMLKYEEDITSGEFTTILSKKARRTKIDVNSEDKLNLVRSVHYKNIPIDSSIGDEMSSLPTHFGKKLLPAHRRKRPKRGNVYPNKPASIDKSDCSWDLRMFKPFDICESCVQSKLRRCVNKEGNQLQLEDLESIRQILRPGMVLLKRYIKPGEQIDIVKQCRDLGMGPGGFYQPSFRYGAKLRLQMMCLGLNWDLETRKYEELRPFDSSKPPGIPCSFSSLVEQAIQDSHALIREEHNSDRVEEILPFMTPNICIVNFYSTNGRLGLHQDRDESTESLRKGLPVVSFSIGDSAEFLYGDQRDADKAKKVLLESGDVLIFGGDSRHIYHGVTSIIPGSAPIALCKDSKLRSGRLNLTFRQY